MARTQKQGIRMIIKHARPWPATLLFFLLLGSLGSQASEVGSTLPAISLDDQHGQPQQLQEDTRRIYASADRKADKLLAKAMKNRSQADLDAQRAIVIGEISAAPGFVKRIIRSGLKDRSYQTWVDDRGKTKKLLPYRPDRLAVIDLQARKIIAVQQISDLAELEALLTQTLDTPNASAETVNPDSDPQPAVPENAPD